jgi:hypothetical protein
VDDNSVPIILIGLTVATSLISVALTYFEFRRKVYARSLIMSLLKIFVTTYLPKDFQGRVKLYLYDRSTMKFYPFVHYGSLIDESNYRRIDFHPSTGIIGEVVYRRSLIRIDLTKMPKEEVGTLFKMSADQISLMDGLKWVIGIPMFSDNRGEGVTGVLLIESVNLMSNDVDNIDFSDKALMIVGVMKEILAGKIKLDSFENRISNQTL